MSGSDYHSDRYEALNNQGVQLKIYWYYGLFDPEGIGDDSHNKSELYSAYNDNTDTPDVKHDYTEQLTQLGKTDGEFIILMQLAGPNINYDNFSWFMNVEDIIRLGFGMMGLYDSRCLSVSHTGLLSGPDQISWRTPWFLEHCGAGLEAIQEYGIHPFFELNDGRFNLSRGVNMLFLDCEYLNYIQDNIFETPFKETWPDDYIPELEGLGSTFARCKSLKKIPSSLGPWVEYSKARHYMYTMQETFSDCTSLQEFPEYLTKDFPALSTVGWMCEGCTSLTSLPEDLFINCPNLTDVQYAFKGCTGLKHLPPLWETLKENQEINYTGCFEGCTQADNYEEAKAQGWA